MPFGILTRPSAPSTEPSAPSSSGFRVLKNRGAFGLGMAETIGAVPPLSPSEVFPTTRALAEAVRRNPSLASYLTTTPLGVGAVGLDVLRAAFAPVSAGIEQTTRLAQGRPLLPATSAIRAGLSGFPEDDRATAAVRAGLELGVFNAVARPVVGTARLAGRALGRATAPTLSSQRILAAPVEELVRDAQASGQRAGTILRTLRVANSPKFKPVFEAMARQRQAPRQVAGLLPNLASQRGAVELPSLEAVRSAIQKRFPRLNAQDVDQVASALLSSSRTLTTSALILRMIGGRAGVHPQGFARVLNDLDDLGVPDTIMPSSGEGLAADVQARFPFARSAAQRPLPQAVAQPRLPLGVRPSGLTVAEAARTHPGVRFGSGTAAPSEVVGLVSPEGHRILPVSRATAAQFEGRLVEVKPGQYARQVFRAVPPEIERTGQATGLQYWYAYDLPATSGVRYPGRAVRTPPSTKLEYPIEGPSGPSGASLVFGEPQPPTYGRLVRTRSHAIRLVTRELLDQARIMREQSGSLIRTIREEGGIDPRKGGGITEEIRLSIPKGLLRRGGRAIDELAADLATRGLLREGTSNELLEALASVRGVRPPTFPQLRQEAIRIVDSEPGQRILQALQEQGATSKAVKTLIQDITRQTQRELRQAGRVVGRIVKQTALTPAQLARIARTQRVEPGATVSGPRGGTQEAALSPEDVAQIQSRVGGIVPSGLTPAQRERMIATGQILPPQGPPKIPTATALVPQSVPAPGTLRDIPAFQQTGLGGVDPDRLAELIDGKPLGWTHQTFIRPAVEADEMQARFLEDFERRAEPLIRAANATPGTESSTKIQRFVEGNLEEGQRLTPEETALEQFGRQTYEELLERVNADLRMAGKPLVQRRANYAPHFQEIPLLESLFGGIEHIPDALLRVTFVSQIVKTPKARRRDAFRDLPEDILNALPFLQPKTPFFRHALRRLGGPFTEDYTEGLRRYVSSAARVIYQTPVVLRGRAMLRYLPPRAQIYFRQHLNELVGRPASLDTLIQFDPFIKQIVSRAGRFQSLGLIGANLSTIIKQPDAIALTLALNGPVATIRAMMRWFDSSGSGRDLVSRYASEFALRQRRGSFLEFSGTTELDKALTFFLGIMDRQQVGIAWLAGVEKGRMQGITDWDTLIGLGNRSVIRTQASMRNLLRSNRLRSKMYRSTFGLLQSFTDNITNFLWFDIAMIQRIQAGNRAALASALGLLASVVTIKAIYDQLGLPSGYDVGDFAPGALKAKLRSSRFGDPPLVRLLVGVPAGLIGLMEQPTDARRKTQLQQDFVKGASAFFAGGNQIRKTFEGVIAASRGGRFTKRGQRQFPISGAAETARAVFFGPWRTKAGQAFIRRGFKPEPSPLTRPRRPSRQEILNQTRPSPFRFSFTRPAPGTSSRGFRILQKEEPATLR